MEEQRLEGQHVRIIWKEYASKTSNKNEQLIFRGQVYQKDESGLWLWGSFFTEIVDTITVRELPRQKDAENRLYYAPFSSLEVIQIVQEGTPDYEVHQVILGRRGEHGDRKEGGYKGRL